MELNDSFLLDFCINADFLDNTIDYTDTLDHIESSQGENKEIVPTSNTVGQEIVKDIDNNKTNKSENDTVKLDKRFKIIKDEEHKKILDNSILVAYVNTPFISCAMVCCKIWKINLKRGHVTVAVTWKKLTADSDDSEL